ncbi:unnamed protein product [Gadus morhua 'NCC']
MRTHRISMKLMMTMIVMIGKDSLIALKVGYGICETPADFENTQLKWSYPLSFNADSDSTHSKHEGVARGARGSAVRPFD